ncbi:unnamed protein product, partial [Gordionus sp. m RMFG-2023]
LRAGCVRLVQTFNKQLSCHHTRSIRHYICFSTILRNEKSQFSLEKILKCLNIGILSRKYSTTTNSNNRYDLAIVGGGIIGLATAQEMISRYPTMKIVVVEKEGELASHQSGHNSGVIHAGVYYTPGTLKAKLCVQGAKMAYEFCDANGIPYKKCGKLIVAVEIKELSLLDNLMERGIKNGVPGIKMIEGKDISSIEPHCKGLRAIHSPNTGIVDWKRVSQKYGSNFKRAGGKIILNYQVINFKMNPVNSDYPILVRGEMGQNKGIKDIQSKYVITCAGLYSDKVAEMSGCSSDPKIVPFRGEYLMLKPDKRHLIRGNIYPVPDPRFPFLGVHFTPRMDGNIWLGPNAVLAFSREGYSFRDINFGDMLDYLKFSGFRSMSYKYLGPGIKEMYGSIFLSAKIAALKRYVPELKASDVMPGPAGVRAQALDTSGQLVDDFVFDSGKGVLGERTLHVRNAPSPAATSSLAISKMVADKAREKFKLVEPLKNSH